MTRIATAFGMEAREVRRTPVLLALLVFLPAYLVGVFALVAPDSSVTFELGTGEIVSAPMTEVFPAFTTPMVAALLTGIAGLFLVQTAAEADARLVLTGYRAHQLLLSRLGILAVIALVGSLVSVGVMRLAFAPNHLAAFGVAVFLTALIYGTVGVVVGAVLDRLPGVYLLLFGTTIDLFLFQNPLATDPPSGAVLGPGHFPVEFAMEAGFGSELSAGVAGWSLLVLGALALLGTATFYRTIRA